MPDPTTAGVLACENTRVEQASGSSGTAAEQVVARDITVRYWAAARAAAGRVEDAVSAATMADVLAGVRRIHADNRRLLEVLEISSFLVGARPMGGRDPGTVMIGPDEVVEVLPPFAGG